MIKYEEGAIEYLSKLSQGGMRDAITLMDKCLAYSKDLTLENVVKALGTTDYDTMLKLTDRLIYNKAQQAIAIIEDIYNDGKDLKLFVRQYIQFLLDIDKFGLGCSWAYLQIPRLANYEDWLNSCSDEMFSAVESWLSVFLNLNSDLKWSQSAKYDIEATVVINCENWRDK